MEVVAGMNSIHPSDRVIVRREPVTRLPNDPRRYILRNKTLLEYYRKRGIKKEDLKTLLYGIKFEYESLPYSAHFEIENKKITVSPKFATSNVSLDTILVHEIEHRIQAMTDPHGKYSMSEFGAYFAEMRLSRTRGLKESAAVSYQLKRFSSNMNKKERDEMRKTLRWLYRLCEFVEPHSIICHGVREGLQFAKKETL